MLMSPRFVNHLEIDGTRSRPRRRPAALIAYEIASRLSYIFWQTMPDEALFAAAADGSLATDAGFAAQLDRVFADPRTRDTLWQFWNEWLRLRVVHRLRRRSPGFESLAAGEPVGVAGHDHYGDMVQEIRDLTDSTPGPSAGTFARPDDLATCR